MCRHSLITCSLLFSSTLVLAKDTADKSNYSKPLETVVVTATQEARAKSDLPESIGVLNRPKIQQIMPAHPCEALNRVTGVYMNNLGGEGHMPPIRQPLRKAQQSAAD